MRYSSLKIVIRLTEKDNRKVFDLVCRTKTMSLSIIEGGDSAVTTDETLQIVVLIGRVESSIRGFYLIAFCASYFVHAVTLSASSC
jgi:hypothetical protein